MKLENSQNSRSISTNKRLKLRVSLYGQKLMGFWISRTSDGLSYGPSIPEGAEPYYMTFFRKEARVKTHMTTGKGEGKKHINGSDISEEEFERKIHSIGYSFCESLKPFQIQPNVEVIYFGSRLLASINELTLRLIITSYKGREVIKDIQIDRLEDRIPVLIEEIRSSPNEYFGSCKAEDILENPQIGAGITKDGYLILADKDNLLGFNLSVLGIQSASPFDIAKGTRPLIYDLTELFGLPQLFEEIKRRRTFDWNLM